MLGAPKLRIVPMIDLRRSSFGSVCTGFASNFVFVGVFGFGVGAVFGVGGTLLAEVDVRYLSNDVGGNLGFPVRSVADLFIRGVCSR